MSNLVFQGLGVVSPIVATSFATEQEARAWLAEKRRAYLART